MRIAAALLLLPVAAFAAAATPHVQVTVNEGGPTGRHHHRRQAVHVLHLADDAEEADPVSASHGERDGRDAWIPARSAQGRARGSPASRRALVELRRRQRPGLLEQLRRDPGRAGAQDGHHPPSAGRRGQERRRPGRARQSRWSGSDPTRSRCCTSRRGSSSAATGDTRTIDRLTTLTALDQRVDLPRHQGRISRHARRARPRAACRQARGLHRRVRQGDRGARCSTTPA